MPQSQSQIAKRARVRAKTGGRCAYCGFPIPVDPFRWRMNPANPACGKSEANLVPACVSCHRRKIGKDATQFRDYIKERITRRLDESERELMSVSAPWSLIGSPFLTALDSTAQALQHTTVEFYFDEVINAAMRLES